MVTNDATILRLKHDVLYEVAKAAWEGNLEEKRDEIPYDICLLYTSTALGMSWKSGVAAEVIGIPQASIGEQLYYSKLYLDTAGLFAWTFAIIVISAVFERFFLSLLMRVRH